MDHTNDFKGPKEAVFEHLTRNARHLSSISQMQSFCLSNGLDERDAWEYLSESDIDDEYKDEIQARCKRLAVLFIRASDMIEDGPIPGISLDNVRSLFQELAKIADDTRGIHVGRLSPDKIKHLIDRGIRPDMIGHLSMIMARLCQYIKHRISWECYGYVPARENPSSVLIPDDPEAHIERWIREHDPGVMLEIKPGRYESVMCAVIFDESALLDSWLVSSIDRSKDQEISDQASTIDHKVMPEIAKAFEKWFDTDDETLSYIIHNHKLPYGHNRVSYRGITKSDAVRFWKAIGMTPGEWNACFKSLDGDPIQDNALAKELYKDQDKNCGIWVPLREYDLIK